MKRLVKKHRLHLLLMSVLVAAGIFAAVAAAWAQTGLPTVGFTVTSQSVDEGAGTLTVEVSLSSNSLDTITVQYTTYDGTAVAPDDYTAASGTLTFSPGTTTQNIIITIKDDAAAENAETATIVLSNPQNCDLGTNNLFTFTIIDNDGGSTTQAVVYFEYVAWVYDEAAGTATITVVMTGNPTGTVNVDYATSDGSATAGADYNSASGTLSWSPAESRVPKSFTITILADSNVEPTESVELTLSNPVNAVLGSQSTARLYILDDDDPDCSNP